MKDELLKVFTEWGFDSGVSSPHGWRRSYPERYGPCDCPSEVADAVLALVREVTLDAIRQCAPYNMELRTDPVDLGTEDPGMAAYVEGVGVAYDAVKKALA